MGAPDQVLDWLLGEDNPPVRSLTLTGLLGESPRSKVVRQARSRVMEYGVTRGILRHADAFWGDDDRAYWKYTGKYWQLIFLGQFLADGKDPRIAGGVKGILENRKWISEKGGQCLTANVLAALRRLGAGDHPVVEEETESLAGRILADGGIRCDVMDYSLLPRCYMAQPKLLLLFGEIPPKRRSPAVNAAVKLLTENLLENEVYVYIPGTRKEWEQILKGQPKRRDLPKGQTVKGWIEEKRTRLLKAKGSGKRQPKQGWLRFGFPLHYNSDVLEAMLALANLGVPMDPRLKMPLQAVKDKMTAEGRWIMGTSLNGKMLADVEEKGKPSKWLTYFGHRVLGHFDAA